MTPLFAQDLTLHRRGAADKHPPCADTVDSGSIFIGKIPAHWSTRRLKLILREPLQYGANEAADTDDPNQPRFIRITDIADDGTLREDTFRSLPEETARPFLLRDGDVLLARSGATVGKSFFYRPTWGRAAYAGYLIRARLDLSKATPRFLHFFAQSDPYWQWVQSIFIQSTIQNVSAEKYANLVVPIPPLDEQRAVTAFLDRETAKINDLTGTTLTLLSRLKEKNASLISFVLTQGVTSPNVGRRLKPAGVPWLDDIPEHWEMVPIKYLAEVGNGSTPSRENPDYWQVGRFPWLTSSVVNLESVTEATEYVSDLALKECHLPRIKPPAVLVGITGEGRTRGMATTLLFEATINQHLAYLKPQANRCDVRFLRQVLDLAYQFLRDDSDRGGSTKGAITCEQLGNLRIPLPPLAEQTAIVNHLDAHAEGMSALVSKVEQAVKNLQQLRASLITNAVTGQIDVRNYHVEAP